MKCALGPTLEVVMLWWVLILVVLAAGLALAWWTSGRTTGPMPPGLDRSRTDGYMGGDPFNQGGGGA
jgi:hypothetical protein